METYSSIIPTPIGNIEVTYNQTLILQVVFLPEHYNNNNYTTTFTTPLGNEIQTQFSEYFNKKRKEFDLPFVIQTKQFSTKCLQIVNTIPYGKTLSYKEVATLLNNPYATRAVGNALNKNPVPLIIPCHRVIATNSSLTGYKYGI